MFQRLKKKQNLKKMTCTRKPIKMNEIYCKRVWAGDGKVNISI